MKPLIISRHAGGRWWWGVLITYNLMLLGQNTIGLIIANLVSKGSLLQVGMFYNLFAMDALQVACSFFTHIRITSWVESMLCMSMHSFGWLGYVGCHKQIKAHNIVLSFIMGL